MSTTTKMEMARLNLLSQPGPNTQRVAILAEPGRMELNYAQIPEPQRGEVRIKIKYVGICGSDLEAYRGVRAPEFLSTPARLGHEIAGVIDKLGEGVDTLRLGQRVTCRYVWGAYAEYIVCKPFNVLTVPDNIPMLGLSLIEILPCVLHAAQLARIDASKNVLIMGQGVSGLMLTQMFQLFSPKALAVTDLYERNLALARRYGATHAYQMPSPDASTRSVTAGDFPDGFDVVVPALLEGDGMVDAVDACAMCGRIVMYGCIGPCRKPLDFFKVHRKRLEIYSTEPRSDHQMRQLFRTGLQYVSDGLINTTEIIKRVLPLSEIQQAFELRNQNDPSSIHIVIDCEA